MHELEQELKAADVGKVTANESLVRHTTLKVGGPVDLLVDPKNFDGLKKTLDLVKAAGVSWRAIGRGSNLLVDDAGIAGVLIKMGRGLGSLEVEGEEVTAGGGYPFVALATVISKKGLLGLEFAAGIPGSVGGAVYMNAGAHGSDVSKILKKALILFEDGTLRWLSNEEMDYSYRTSILQKQAGICVRAVFQLQKGDPEQIFANMKAFKDYRRRTQPVDRCCGSVFRNPLPQHAGHLIEEAGLKGYKIGGAQVSELHSNFIINVDSARAEDVSQLIEYIKKTIHEKYQLQLHTEVERIPRNRP